MRRFRFWTTREISFVRHYANEGLSVRRTAETLRLLHNLDVTRGQVHNVALRHGIKFRAQPGPQPSTENPPSKRAAYMRAYHRRRRLENQRKETR